MIDFDKRLSSLKERRQGSRERAILESIAMDSVMANAYARTGRDIRKTEAFETLKESNSIKYAIGAMAPVDPKSTEISINEGHRVADSLIKSLTNQNEYVIKRLQGSVALDIHIRGHSDVDMLIIIKNQVKVQTPKIDPTRYKPSSDPRNLIDILKDVRNKAEKILPINFPAVDINCKGNKSIALSGGSLLRKVDIVPAVWFDSLKYQLSSLEHDRGIKIYHKNDHKFILNYPFTHMKLVNERDAKYSGNLKCVIRLMKNMIADMPDYKHKQAKKLTSYDLAAIAYHMDTALIVPYGVRLGLVEKLRVHLSLLVSNQAYRNSLSVPDDSRKIFDDYCKEEALNILYQECTDLAYSIFKDLQPARMLYEGSTILSKMVG